MAAWGYSGLGIRGPVLVERTAPRGVISGGDVR